ncbi:MAG: hypothetical protein ATN34_02080, partial [Epulopiscium sp. Nele67-Bin002]
TPDPPVGKIGRVDGTMEPNGYLEGQAILAVLDDLFQYLQFHLFDYVQQTQLEYLKYGVTTVQDSATNSANIALLKMLAAEDKLLVDIVAYPIMTPEAIETMDNNQQYVNQYNNHLKLGGYTIIADGALQSKLAWLTTPYENCGDYVGHAYFTDAQLERLIANAAEDNLQILVHCNGDAAADQLIRGLHKVPNVNRPMMLHCSMLRDDQLDAMKQLNIIPSMFTGQIYYYGDVNLEHLSPQIVDYITPVKAVMDNGLLVNFNQNGPMTKPNPLFSVWAAVNRVTKQGSVLGEQHKCSVYDALKAVTINAAYAYFDENTKGSIKEGKVADLVILDKNPLEVEHMEIKNIKIIETIKNGVAYKFDENA